ncbi:hypothetical protein Tco_0207468, partial [Tanacetum coccineum]
MVPQTACRTLAVRPRDQDDHQDDDHPEGENSAKRQKTSKYKAYGYRVYNKRTRLIVESIHIKFDEIKEMSVENVTSGLVPQVKKALDYDNSGPVPPRQNVVHTAEKTDSS